MKGWTKDATIIAALIGVAGTLLASLIPILVPPPGDKSPAPPERPLERPPVSTPQPPTALPRSPPARPPFPEIVPVQPTATAAARLTTVFEALVRQRSPEVIGRVRLEIAEEQPSGRVEVKALWSAGLEGTAVLHGVHNARGEINAHGIIRVADQHFDCYLSAILLDGRRLEGEYSISDPQAPGSVQKSQFSAHRL